MSIDTFVADGFRRWLDAEFPLRRVRQLEACDGVAEAWQAVHDNGFCDGLISEEQGGAGISMATAAQMLMECGRHALPLPFAATLWVRAVLAEKGMDIPSEPICLARGYVEDNVIHCPNVDLGCIADWVLVSLREEDHMPADEQIMLLPTASADHRDDDIPGSLNVYFAWHSLPDETLRMHGDRDWTLIGAALFAAQIAGAAEGAMSLALEYANEREQFGRRIGKFQALQQRLAVLAEEVFAARMATQMAFQGEDLTPLAQAAMIAKARTSAAISEVTAIAHLVHGAIGVTREHDLQLFTRRLHSWRVQFGSAPFWHRQLGADVLAHDESPLATVRRWAEEPA